MRKKLKKILAILIATCITFGMVSVSSAEESNQGTTTTNKYAQSKTATDWIDDVYTDVTLTVGGEQSDLGVDIVYIVGSYASNADGSPNVEGDVLISSLVETIAEIVEMGTIINFGMIPFSSDNVVAMPLTVITKENIANLSSMIANALATCEALYDGVNMENALIKSKKMFSESALATHPERQHLVMITSGFTYFFNSGENNEYVSTVPVNFVHTNKTTVSNQLFYTNKAWQRARTAQTNTYPLPKVFTQYQDSRDWDLYWSYIDAWARSDIAAGDKVVYKATTIESADFLQWLNSGSTYDRGTTFGYNTHGAYITDITGVDLSDYVTMYPTENPLEEGSNSAHAILYERAMWEAYEYSKANIIGAGINFYPIYNALNVNYTNGNWSPSSYGVNWTNQYIGHSFVNMLAGGKAVMYDKQGDKAFFDSIKRSILYSLSAGTSVVDYIGYNDDPNKGDIYDFDFVDVDKDNKAVMPILKVGNKIYITEKLAAANSGATCSYVFKAPEKAEPTFTLDYYRGNGKEEEHFIWNFGENVSKFAPVSLTYRLKLMDKKEMPGTYTVYTNQSATLKPIDSDGNPGSEEKFERPTLTYKADGVNINVTKSWEDDSNRDNIRPSEVKIRLFIENREELALADNETIDTINNTDIVEEVTLNAENNWQHSWSGLRKFLNGKKIIYTVEEVEVPEKYTDSLSEESINNVRNITVTNQYKPEETTVSVEKVWDDANNQDGLQPKSVRVELLANEVVLADKTVELSAANKWKHTWTVWKNEAGEPITYTVQEVPLPEEIRGEYTVAITGEKNEDGVIYSYTITNSHTPYVRDISVNKIWDDDSNRDGIRPENVTVNLLADGEVLTDKTVILDESNEWGYVWKDLPVNKTPGTPIVYTVEEKILPGSVLETEYTATVAETENGSGIFVITNTHVPYKTSVTVNKEWDDQENKYGFRTESVQVQLKADDAPYGDVVTLSSENEWKYTWDDLFVNKLDENNETKEIIYTVEEVNVPQYYDVTVTGSAEAKCSDDEGNTWYDYTITNSLQKTSIILTKYIDEFDEENAENATPIFRYLITGGPNNDYRANVTINFENGTVKVNGVVQGEADTDLSDNIGFNKAGLSVTIDGLDSGDYTIIEYATRGYELVQMSDKAVASPNNSAKAINGVQNPLEVTTIVNAPGEAYYWNRYNVPDDYTAVNRFSVNENGNLDISIKRK